MRILYESLLFDVTRPQAARGPGHVIYRVLQRDGVELQVLGPPPAALWGLERLVRRIYRRLTGRRYLRFPLSQAARLNAALEAAVVEWEPDVVLSMFPPALWGYGASVPVVYRVDSTYRAMVREYPDYGYGPAMAALASHFQARACRRSTLLVTHSSWCRSCLMREYGVASDRIRVFANTGGLPTEVVPGTWEGAGRWPPLRLLFIGADRHRKALDIALEVVRLLDAAGVETRLTVCGPAGEDTGQVRYVGSYDKSAPHELEEYASLYRQSHLLLHPTRFDTWAMVTSEAAAFGVPTLTNAVAGMSASVLDGDTGLVLEKHSPPQAYADALIRLLENPDLYRRLSQGARERYERESSWHRFGDNLMAVLMEANKTPPPKI